MLYPLTEKQPVQAGLSVIALRPWLSGLRIVIWSDINHSWIEDPEPTNTACA